LFGHTTLRPHHTTRCPTPHVAVPPDFTGGRFTTHCPRRLPGCYTPFGRYLTVTTVRGAPHPHTTTGRAHHTPRFTTRDYGTPCPTPGRYPTTCSAWSGTVPVTPPHYTPVPTTGLPPHHTLDTFTCTRSHHLHTTTHLLLPDLCRTLQFPGVTTCRWGCYHTTPAHLHRDFCLFPTTCPHARYPPHGFTPQLPHTRICPPCRSRRRLPAAHLPALHLRYHTHCPPPPGLPYHTAPRAPRTPARLLPHAVRCRLRLPAYTHVPIPRDSHTTVTRTPHLPATHTYRGPHTPATPPHPPQCGTPYHTPALLPPTTTHHATLPGMPCHLPAPHGYHHLVGLPGTCLPACTDTMDYLDRLPATTAVYRDVTTLTTAVAGTPGPHPHPAHHHCHTHHTPACHRMPAWVPHLPYWVYGILPPHCRGPTPHRTHTPRFSHTPARACHRIHQFTPGHTLPRVVPTLVHLIRVPHTPPFTHGYRSRSSGLGYLPLQPTHHTPHVGLTTRTHARAHTHHHTTPVPGLPCPAGGTLPVRLRCLHSSSLR